MAFSFTLPELRAELRALGHDGLPDHLILSFLSQLHPPAPPSDSSGYDTEASTCSAHSLSCGYGSSKECGQYTGDRVLQGCADHLPKTLSALCDHSPDERTSCAESPSLPDINCAAEFQDSSPHTITACRLEEGLFGCKLPKSRVSVEREQSLNRGNGAEFPGHHAKGAHHAKGTDHSKQGNTDNIIEHYWISVGEEHMRAMHSKISKEKEHFKEPSVLESHGDPDTSIDGCIESKNGCESLIAKVQRCEHELQCLNLSLQAQQCKKPWFLEAARKPRVFHQEKHEICSKSDPLAVSDPMPASDSALEGCGEHSLQGQSYMVTGSNIGVIVDKGSGNPCFSSLEHVNECLEAESEILTMTEERSRQMVLSKVDGDDTMKANLAVILSVGDVAEVRQIEDTENKLLADVCPDQNNDPDHSVCSKSSSTSYQHSRSSGDSRSNGSQQLSTCLSSRKRQQHKKRGGKIDRVARFAEMQRLWKKDTFLAANEAGGKRKGVQSFHHLFSSLHSSNSY